MLFGKTRRLNATENLVSTYEAYRKAMVEFTKATGWKMKLDQTISSYEEDAQARDEVVKRLNEIDKKYND